VIGRPTQLEHPASTSDCGVSMAMPDKQAGCRGRAGKGGGVSQLEYNHSMDIPVGQLQVIIYIPIRCPKHRWDLSVRSVKECPYYLCIKNGDRTVYDTYMDLISKRPEAKSQCRPYDDFMRFVEGIRQDGGYRSDKAARDPMRIYKGTMWLLDGHHRVAVICALFGPRKEVPVKEIDEALPADLDQCANPGKH
jgi:hypothetical protein